MGKNIQKDEIQVYKADLHIHTPASKCYKGPKEDAEYLRIIEKAEEKGLKIIALTDHNSIDGYEKLIEQKERIKVKVEGFKTLNDSKEAKRKIKEGEKILKLFDSILILPGVEFEVNNGVHMLVIFNPKTEITTIKGFLKNGGFEDDSFGKGDDVFSNWSLFDFYKEAEKYDCLILDAHTDSDKGIYKTIREGMPLIHAFTDTALVGICYKNEKQRNKICELFSQPNYKRTTPVAFLKSSDAHKIEEIGKEKTFFRLKKLEWSVFKDSFNNPDEYIFTSIPSTKHVINNISNTGKCIFISGLNESSVNRIAESVCGLSNSDGGYIVIGAESEDIVNGIEIKDNKGIEAIIKMFDDVSTKTKKNNIHFNPYPLKDDYFILVVKVDKEDELIDVENQGIIYGYKKGNIVTLNASQIQQVLSQKVETRYQHHISRELAVIGKSVSAIDTYLKSQPIISSYCKNNISINKYISSFDVQRPTRLTSEQKQTLLERSKKQVNGCYKGNTIFVDGILSPRLKDAYLRITPPKFTLRGLKRISDKKYLYIIPGGAVFYSESELHYHNNKDFPVLKLEITNGYSIKFLCAFLKSSFFLWYVKNKFGDFDFFPPKIFNYITIPTLHLNNPTEKNLITKIEENIDNIIELEKTFLKTGWEEIQKKEDYVIQHNEKTKNLFKEIDELIFSLLKLKDEEVLIIKENLRANYIFIPE